MTNLPVMVHWSVFILFLTFGVSVSAEVFKSVEPEGTVIYTDRPTRGAQTIKTWKGPPPAALTSPASSPTSAPNPPPKSKFTGYQKIEIVSPSNDEDIRENAGNVTVSVALTPALEKDHKLVLFLDGNKVEERSDTAGFQLTNVGRGTHELRIAVMDAAGKEIASSASSVFHLKRFSALFAPGRAPQK